MKVPNLFFFAAILSLMPVQTVQTAWACTWAAYANGPTAVVARTMDWYHNDHAVVKGVGRNIEIFASNTPDALRYKTRYASLQICSMGFIATDALNEKGLQGSLLYLEGSLLPKARSGRQNVSAFAFLPYAVSSFATVRELVDALQGINIVASPLPIPLPINTLEGLIDETTGKWPGHFAFSDATGDKAVIEFRDGELKLYHGKEHAALSNEPPYDVHLKFDATGDRPLATISPLDRRATAKFYLSDMYKRNVTDSGRALLAMRGLLAAVTASTEEVDPDDGVVYPTIWSVLADQNAGVYYLSRYTAWDTERYDFSLFSKDEPEITILSPMRGDPAPIPYDAIHLEAE